MKLLNKFRHWLIHKLGGFTEQKYFDDTNSYTIRTISPEVIPLEVGQFIDAQTFLRMQETGFESLYNMLANEIGYYIVNNNLYYELNEETHQILDGVRFKWRVWIVNPKDMIKGER